MRQPGTDDDHRQARLGDLVAGRADRRDVVGREVLHLVDEHGDPAADVRGQPTDVGEQLHQVDLDVTGVGAPGDRRGVDARVPPVAQLGARSGVALGEGLDHTEHVVDLVAGRVSELADRHVQRSRQWSAQALVGPGLELAGAPVGAHGRRPQGVEQHGLADAPQAGQDDGTLGAPAGDPLQHDVEGVQLLVAAGQLGRALAGAGGIGVANRVHDRSVWALSRECPRFRHTRRSCRAATQGGDPGGA